MYGFKLRKEKSGAGKMNAKRIADFYAEQRKNAPGEQAMSKAAIDQCLTILNRVFSIPRCEKIVADIEKIFGPAVNNIGLSLNFLRDMIYYYCYNNYYYYYYTTTTMTPTTTWPHLEVLTGVDLSAQKPIQD